MRGCAGVLLIGLLTGCERKPTPPPPDSYIEVLYSLRQILDEADVIAVGVLESVDSAGPRAVVRIDRNLKGTCRYARFTVNFSGGGSFHPQAVRKHLVRGTPVIAFHVESGVSEFYFSRFFAQAYFDPRAGGENAPADFTHIETLMNRAYCGSVDDLAELIPRILGGQVPSPAPNPDAPPITETALRDLPAPGRLLVESLLPAPFRRKVVPLIPRAPEDPETTAPGLRFEYFEGSKSGLADLDLLKPVEEGVMPFPDPSRFAGTERIGLRFKGYLDAPRDGDYALGLESDGRGEATLFIGTASAVSAPGGSRRRTGDVALRAGKHAFRLDFPGSGGERKVGLFWSGPGFTTEPIPPSALVHSP
jgi:hypothetical protein